MICVECGRTGRLAMPAYADNGKGGKKIIGGICKKCLCKGIGRQHNKDTGAKGRGWREGFSHFMESREKGKQ
jgi:hypothetical protein